MNIDLRWAEVLDCCIQMHVMLFPLGSSVVRQWWNSSELAVQAAASLRARVSGGRAGEGTASLPEGLPQVMSLVWINIGFGYLNSRFASRVAVSDPCKRPAGPQGSQAGEQTQVLVVLLYANACVWPPKVWYRDRDLPLPVCGCFCTLLFPAFCSSTRTALV